jgi:mono/diheme cytochrome c family protein
MSRQLLQIGYCIFAVSSAATLSFAADADQGKTLAERWCMSCHLVERDQKSAADQAPPFGSIARMPDFNANKLAFLLLLPHPNMPKLALTRAEIAGLADYIATLK